MTNPALWGPALWQALFACAWRVSRDAQQLLFDLLTRQMPPLLPCEACRAHYVKRQGRVDRRAGGPPDRQERAFRWLWYLKDEVNRANGQASIDFDDLTQRFALHGGAVDDVALGDALVLVAMEARHNDRDALFLEFCAALAALLPLPHDSELRTALLAAHRPIVPFAVRAARAARVERGLAPFSLAHYRVAADDDDASSLPKRPATAAVATTLATRRKRARTTSPVRFA
jgi:hypothetical protein